MSNADCSVSRSREHISNSEFAAKRRYNIYIDGFEVLKRETIQFTEKKPSKITDNFHSICKI